MEGRVYIAFADGCTGTCASGNDTTASNSRDRLGSVYYLGNGPSLYESVGDLTEFYPSNSETFSATDTQAIKSSVVSLKLPRFGALMTAYRIFP